MQDNNKDGYGVMIAKKSERLVTALYIVTDLIDGSEPIKNGLKELRDTFVFDECSNAIRRKRPNSRICDST